MYKYEEYKNLSPIEKLIVDINLPKKVGLICHSVLNDWKGNLFCRTNLGLIILWGVLQ